VTCHELPLAEFVDGELDAATERQVERHLEECPDCRALVADLRTVRAAAFTLDRQEPPAALLSSLQARIAAERAAAPPAARWPNTPAAWGVWLAAAAALVLATSMSVMPLLRQAPLQEPSSEPASGQAVEGAALVDSVEADLKAAEAHYEKAIQGLEQIARSNSSELEPQVAAVLQKNLQVVDQAIGESRAALRDQPSNPDVQGNLFEAMRTKVSLLQQTVELINEMRKGNQAEAGRLMQDMSR
jgi:anti-sigma factor RsiW